MDAPDDMKIVVITLHYITINTQVVRLASASANLTLRYQRLLNQFTKH